MLVKLLLEEEDGVTDGDTEGESDRKCPQISACFCKNGSFSARPVCSESLPGLGLSRLHPGEASAGVSALSHFISCPGALHSSSLSVALSSIADSLPECSAEVTFSSMSRATGRTPGPSAVSEEEEEEHD